MHASVSQHNKSNTGRLTRQEVAAALKEAHAPYGAALIAPRLRALSGPPSRLTRGFS